MKRVLVLTYYYPPCKGVPSYRPYSWSLDFPRLGFATTVITRHWTGSETKWEEYLGENSSPPQTISDQNSKTIYLPYKKNRFVAKSEKIPMRKTGLSKFLHFYMTVKGDFQPDIDAYNCFANAAEAEL